MTQCERVLKYMEDFGTINPLQAIADIGVLRLAARISDLKKRGHKINKKTVAAKNRYGDTVCFAEYRLTED